MMKKVFLVCLIMLMIGSTVLASESDTLIIKLASSDPGDKLQVTDIDWPKNIDEQIKLVNAGRGEFFLEIYNDATVWQVVNWLKKQPGTAVLDSNQMNLTYDGGLNTARYQTGIRLYKAKGVERLAFRYVADRGSESMIKGYFVPYDRGSISGSKDTVYSYHTQYLVSKSLDQEVIEWQLCGGAEWTAVSDGRPIFVPAISLVRSKLNSELSLTGGYWPTGENDLKFFAGSFAYFPGENKLGFLARIIYTSEAIKTYGAYVQQGFGPTAGVIWRNQTISLYLTGGVQYFDRLGQDRRSEATVNAGLNFRAITF